MKETTTATSTTFILIQNYCGNGTEKRKTETDIPKYNSIVTMTTQDEMISKL